MEFFSHIYEIPIFKNEMKLTHNIVLVLDVQYDSICVYIVQW